MSLHAGHFADRLIEHTRALGHPLCVGLDPHLEQIAPLFRRGSMQPADPETAEAVERFLAAVLDRLEKRVAIVKPQIAFFEQLGWRGMRILSNLVERAHQRGLMVLLDAKRGDIGSTAEGYARAYLSEDAALRVEALTVNPYLGNDTLEPFAAAAEPSGAGFFVLVKTSNPGSGDLQDRLIDGVPAFERVAESLAELSADLEGPVTGWSSMGVVVGATYPEQSERVRERLPKALFLIPGYGAQGATATDAVRAFVDGPSGREGGIVNSSRAVLFPESANTDSAQRWEQALDQAIDQATEELAEAIR